MRILAHIHTFNDADIIDRTIAAVRAQTRPVDEIVIVDNASSDATLAQPGVAGASVLRLPENTGTSGAVYRGLGYAIEHQYDWIWVFDADSIPEPDALEKLLALYDNFPPEQQRRTAFVTCLPRDLNGGAPQHGGLFTAAGLATGTPLPEARHYPCHFVIWSGCLYRVAAVREIGLPDPNYVLDWGEGEYGYRIMKAGYQGFIHQDAVLHHNIRGHPSLTPTKVKLGPLRLTLFEFPPIRCYYTCRNILYFALYVYAEQRLRYIRCVAWWLYGFPLRFLAKPWSHRRHIAACLRGMWHGISGNIAARY